MILKDSLLLALGIILLNIGANYLVKSAARVAASLGIRPMLIGLTIVAFGTSAPEFVVSIIAAAKHQIGISYGNIVGSNIANIGLILGLSALIRPLVVPRKVLQRELPFLIFITVMLFIFSANGVFSSVEGMIFGLLALVFISYTVYQGMKDNRGLPDYTSEIPRDRPKALRDGLGIVGGILGLYAGSHFVVDSGVGLMRIFGVSELVIGLTVVALGTSLPELATSIVSVRKGETDICVGNVIGSNIFNTIFILGGVSLFGNIQFDQKLINIQMIILTLMTVALLPMLHSENKVDRREGGYLLLGYAVFVFLVFGGEILGVR